MNLLRYLSSLERENNILLEKHESLLSMTSKPIEFCLRIREFLTHSIRRMTKQTNLWRVDEAKALSLLELSLTSSKRDPFRENRLLISSALTCFSFCTRSSVELLQVQTGQRSCRVNKQFKELKLFTIHFINGKRETSSILRRNSFEIR